MVVSNWRKLLISLAVAIGVFDVWYLAIGVDSDTDEISAQWVAYMPTLEERQRRDPSQLLYSSHHWDPAYPHTYLIDDGEPYPLFSKITYDCEVKEYGISQFLGPTPQIDAAQMPDRLFVGAIDARQVQCLRDALPKGYVLAKLIAPISPSKVSWLAGSLPLDPREL